eukprot:TRINITY_DN43259_c0_g1_i1.p1 TRINITY_DN43259_c0_g1~~TRINITY_DN43259_c0_g1_i1.p1  ORF type:complete len:441 (+),score=69.14 TRINITY_DN43259_c0_g1_i1:32-1354(+)
MASPVARGSLSHLFSSRRLAAPRGQIEPNSTQIKSREMSSRAGQWLALPAVLVASKKRGKISCKSLEEMVDRATATRTTRSVLLPYIDSSRWIWRQWTGTILQTCWKPVLCSMLASTVLVTCARCKPSLVGPVGQMPNFAQLLANYLLPVLYAWEHQVTLTTFVVTFFLNQSYNFWRQQYNLARRIQGQLNDIGAVLAACASRGPSGHYTTEALSLLEEVARYVRLTHIFFWASVLKPGRKGDVFNTSFTELLTKPGTKALISRGALKEHEATHLEESAEPQFWCDLVLEWILTLSIDGMKAGTLQGSNSLDKTITEKVCTLRSVYATIDDDRTARMTLTYVHFVHILVDSLIVMTPFAVYPKLGAASILLSGVVTLFYKGILQISHGLFDPFGNEDSTQDNFQVDVLIAQTNAGSLRWTRGSLASSCSLRASRFGSSSS